jgi:STIP1 family protein 1
LNDTESVFFSNRAQCHRHLQDWQLAFKDAVQSVELDDRSIKAHMILGICLAQFGKYESGCDKLENALVKLTKAMTLCAG